MKKIVILAVLLLGWSYGVLQADEQPNIIDQATEAQALKNVNDTLTRARAVPSFDENGQPTGYKIYDPQEHQGDHYQRIGLQEGGTVTNVDDQGDEGSAPQGQEVDGTNLAP